MATTVLNQGNDHLKWQRRFTKGKFAPCTLGRDDILISTKTDISVNISRSSKNNKAKRSRWKDISKWDNIIFKIFRKEWTGRRKLKMKKMKIFSSNREIFKICVKKLQPLLKINTRKKSFISLKINTSVSRNLSMFSLCGINSNNSGDVSFCKINEFSNRQTF